MQETIHWHQFHIALIDLHLAVPFEFIPILLTNARHFIILFCYFFYISSSYREVCLRTHVFLANYKSFESVHIEVRWHY